MSKVAVVIESTTTLPEEMAAKYKLPTPPAIIIWGSEEFRDGIDIQPKEFYERLATAKDHPSTSQATPIMFKEAYEPLIAAGKDILTVTISSKLSGMYSSAIQAKNMFPDANIEVVDTRTAVLGIVWPLKKTQWGFPGGVQKHYREMCEAHWLVAGPGNPRILTQRGKDRGCFEIHRYCPQVQSYSRSQGWRF